MKLKLIAIIALICALILAFSACDSRGSDGVQETTAAPTDKPAEGTTEKPMEAPTDDSLEGSTDKPAEGTTEKPTEVPTDKPSEGSTEKPTEVPTYKPAEGTTEKPTEVPTDKPSEGSTEKPTEVPTDKPSEGSTEKPTEAPTVDPTEPPTEHIHTEVIDEAVEPTCTEDGLTKGSHCDECGYVLVEREVIEALGHTEEKDAAVEATCTDDGLTEGVHCSVCGEILTDQNTVEALGHTEVVDEAVEPTCTEDGLTEGVHCSVCGEILVEQKIEKALGHIETIDKAVDATCTEKGLTEGSSCSACGEIFVAQEIIGALGHTEIIDEAVDATCTETGFTEGIHCSVCGEILVAQEVTEMLEHRDELDEAMEATCTEDGLTEGVHCPDCGTVLVAQEVVAAAHKYSEEWTVDKEPNCTEEGSMSHRCTACGDATDVTAIPSNGKHDYNAEEKCSLCQQGVPYTSGLEFIDLPDGESCAVYGIGDATDTYIYIRTTHNGLTVTQIDEYAFQDNIDIVGVRIPATVKSIGNRAFDGCTSLASVEMTDGVTSIGEYTFSNCKGLADISIPESVTDIGKYAFNICTRLESITLVGNMSIGAYAFENCLSLRRVHTFDIKSWCNISFANNYATPFCYGAEIYINGEKMTALEIPEGVTNIGDYLFYNTSIESLVIPEGVESIGLYTFSSCNLLTSVVLPDGLISIGDSAFKGCMGLLSLTIPDSVKVIGDDAFRNCIELEEVHITDLWAWCGIDFGNFEANPLAYSQGLYVNGEKIVELVIPESITEICKYAFCGYEGLESVICAEGSTLRDIKYRVFYKCPNLRSVNLPSSLTHISLGAFEECTAIESMTLPFVGGYADGSGGTHFAYIFGASDHDQISYNNYGYNYVPKSLTSVTVMGGRIAGYAFYKCSGITSITLGDGVTYVGDRAFEGVNAKESDRGLQYVSTWVVGCDSSVTDARIRTGTKGIAAYAFSRCTGLKSVIIPEGVTCIGDSTFYKCTGLESISIPSSVVSIDAYAFSECTSLSSVEFAEGSVLESIGKKAFGGCKSLVAIRIPKGVKSMGEAVFTGCSVLESMSIPFVGDCAKTADDLYQYTFGYIFGTDFYTDSSGTKQSYYGDSLNMLTSATYYIPTSLKHVTVTGGSILRYAFYGCENIESVTLGEGVTGIGNAAFHSCKKLSSVTLPNSITSIGEYAFYDCSFESIILPDGITSIGGAAFSSCSELTSIYIPESVESVGEVAFINCPALTLVEFEHTGSWRLTHDGNDIYKDVTDSAANVELFKNYSGYTWYRE